jgi:NADH-quinone oxidoreductase subunit D
VGGLSRDLPKNWLNELSQFLDEVEVNFDETDTLLTRNPIFLERTQDVGVISREEAIDFGLSGPNLRGSGVEHDVRRANPYMIYDRFDFEIPVGTKGDAYDRYVIRMLEMRESVKILRQCIKDIPEGPINVEDGKVTLPSKEKVMTSMEELIHQFMIVTQGQDAPVGEIYFGAENPKGELGFYIHSLGGGTPHRMKIRAPSFVNLSILSHLLPGYMMSDVVAILGSLDFVMGECDR